MIKRELVEDFFSREIRFAGIQRELKIPEINKIVSIVGPRRAGKTWHFYSLFTTFKSPMYVNFEDLAFRNIATEEFFDVVKIFSEIKYPPKTLFLDEVQVIKNWEVLARSLYDRGYKIFITGSSSKLLPKEVSTELRGRSLTYILLPFNFREFIRA
ncbi:MAG: AAA family ATPase, partial [Candidatus Bathyarchaeia archaeon]